MDPRRIWKALTSGERLILVASGVLLTLVLLGGAVLLGATPFQSAQTVPAGGQVVDTDGDGLSDDNEALLFGSDPATRDSDGDGMPDGWEALRAQADPLTGRSVPDPASNDSAQDPDGDGLPNRAEYFAGLLTGNASALLGAAPDVVRASCGDDRACYVLTLDAETLLGLYAAGADPEDTATDPWNADTDGDGMTDGWEVQSGHDPLTDTNAQDDLDGDGLTALEEFELNTLDNAVDSDGDGLTDQEEVRGAGVIGGQQRSFRSTDPARTSTGGSGLADGFAVAHDLDPHEPNVGRIDHDEDGLTTAQEARFSLDRFEDPRQALTDGLDPLAADSDDDGLPDGWEVTHGLDPLDSADGDGDSDGDGLTNGQEFFWNTDPLDPDTDQDGLGDGEEVRGWEITIDERTVRATANPLLPDSDNDGLSDQEERNGEAVVDGSTVTFNATHPLLPDSDGDRLPDRQEVALRFGDRRLDPTKADSDGDGLQDGRELTYWRDRAEKAATEFPASLTPPAEGACRGEAASAIQAQDPSVLGPAGDPDGDCIPNILDRDSDRRAGAQLPPNTDPLLDGQEVEPGQVQGRDVPPSDPAVTDTDGDGLPDEWEMRWVRPGRTGAGASTLLFDPTNVDSDADEVPDGRDDDETGCWSQLPNAQDPQIDAVGDTAPWLADQRPFPNRQEMLQGTNPFRCDTDGDGLMDGWEAAYQSTNLDPRAPLEDWWQGARIATACYKQHGDIPTLEDLNVPAISANIVPPAGPVTADPDETVLRPTGAPGDPHTWRVPGAGCSWTGTEAQRGQTCSDCQITGITATLWLQQWYKTSPVAQDTDGDGAEDAWEVLWNQIARGDQRSYVRPGLPDTDGDGDGADLSEEYAEGSNPLVPDTDGDGERDGPDKSPLSAEGGVGPVRDQDLDHLLDGCTGVHQTNDPDRIDTLRRVQIIEVEPNTFLCEPTNDRDSQSADADGDGLPDAWELLYTRRSVGNPSLSTLPNVVSPNDGDQVPDASEYRLGLPADWPEGTTWWFGSNPFRNNGYDADGDGVPEALFLDNDPFSQLPEPPTSGNAFEIACQAGITCPGGGFQWSSTSPSTSLSVSIQQLGTQSGSDTLIDKSEASVPLQVQVDRGGQAASGVPVAIVALDALEAQALRNGDLSQVAQPARVLCILTTNGQGVAQSSSSAPCTAQSSPTQAGLAGTGRTWLGTQSPSWERDLSVLDPTESNRLEGDPENQVRLAAWAMGAGADPGATAQRPVVVSSPAQVLVVDPPASVPSGEPVDLKVRVLDGGGDPVTAGTLTVSRGDFSTELSLEDAANPLTIEGIPMPSVDQARDTTVHLAFQPANAKYIGPEDTDQVLRVLPVPEVQIDTPGTAVANRTLDVLVTLRGPGQAPVAGPVTVSLASAEANGTAGADGRANLTLTVPPDVSPGTLDLSARFLGTESFGPGSAQQQVSVLQQLVTTVTPRSVFLGDEARFTVTVLDLAGRAPAVSTEAALALGEVQANATLGPGEDLLALTLPIEGEIGNTSATLGLRPASKYQPVQRSVDLEVRSDGFVELRPTRVARGENVDLTVRVTDALGRAVPHANLSASWSFGDANVTITNGRGTLPFHSAPHAPAEPVTLTYELRGPGLVPAKRTAEIAIQVGTNLTGDLSLDALAGTVTMDLHLTDDQGSPLAGAPLTVNWPLGEAVEVRTDTEGRAEATLVVPEDASPGDVPVQVRYEGDGTHLSAERFLSAPIRGPTRIDMADEVSWSETKDLRLSGQVVAVDTGRPLNLAIQVLHGGEVVTETDRAGAPFVVTLAAERVADLAGTAKRFTLEIATPGDATHAPAETTVIVQRRVPVELATGVDIQDDLVVLQLKATTPQGPLSQAVIKVGHENGAPVRVSTNSDGEATVTIQGAPGTLIARYDGDDTRSPAETRVDLASQGPADASDLGRIALLALLAALVAADAVILWRVWRRLDLGRRVEQALEEMERGFLAGDEIRAVIYHGYLRLRAIADVMGYPEEEWETPREFGHRLSETLKVRSDPVVGLIDAFEQARYAGSVDPTLRTTVLEDLREVRQDLRDGGVIS